MRNRAGTLGFFLLAVTFLRALQAEQCKPDEAKPCVARCNGTIFDLSTVKDLPGYFTGFGWDPCTGLMCGSSVGISRDCAVCMSIPDSPGLCCGNISNPVWIWETSKMKVSSKLDKFPDWQIEYTNGLTWRISVFSFVIKETQEKPIGQFVGEDYFTYHFHVIGKCIGQQTEECENYYQQR